MRCLSCHSAWRFTRFTTCLLGLAAIFGMATVLQAAPPVVSGISAAQRSGTHLVDIYYSVSDADGNSPLTIYVTISDNAGASYNVPVFTLTGAVGPGVVPGNNLHVVWNAGVDWPGRFNNQCKVKIIADDGTAPPAPTDMAYIPAGVFQMGDSLDSDTSAMPVHTVFVSAFFMDKYEVRKELYQTVYAWSTGHGYSISSGSGKAANHPIQSINWYDAAKWCNARSEMEGLTPCYYTDSGKSTAYKTGNLNITNACVDWSADGYRLPTEAEWERAARGGLNGKRYPWGDSFTHADANYSGDPVYATGGTPYDSPGGSFAANGYGLYDMAGNVWQWTKDVWRPGLDPDALEPETASYDPADPDAAQRVIKGGSFLCADNYCMRYRPAARTAASAGDGASHIGFRTVLRENNRQEASAREGTP